MANNKSAIGNRQFFEELFTSDAPCGLSNVLKQAKIEAIG
jgi:hypothetical protein